MLHNFWNDECGFIISAELVLVATILVLGMMVGLVQLQASVIAELNDVACAIGSLNQSYTLWMPSTTKGGHTIGLAGSSFEDNIDECDCRQCQSLFCTPPTPETTH